MTVVLQILFFLMMAVVAYLPYKGKDFQNISWLKAIKLSARFIVSSGVLVLASPEIYIQFGWPTVVFVTITLIWVIVPAIVRKYGKYPAEFLKAKVNELRFLAGLEWRTMTVKYFEILFQQAGFLFIFFRVLDNVAETSRVIWFTVIIALFHLGNFLFLHPKWVVFYFVLSIPMAIIFAQMLSYGLVFITASIHLLFYIIFNARYWFPGEKLLKEVSKPGSVSR